MLPHYSAPGQFPAGSAIQHIAFISTPGANQLVLLELPPPSDRFAVLVTRPQGLATEPERNGLTLLRIPTTDLDDVNLLTAVQAWLHAVPGSKTPIHMMTLQGSQIFWTERYVAVLANAERLDAVCLAVVEVFFYHAELLEVETGMAGAWNGIEADLPLAYEFAQPSMRHRKELQRRYQQVLSMRVRLARIAPHVYSPHVFPATLASQVRERLKERNRMTHRHEFLTDQLEFSQQLYDSCSQRANDFMLTRSSNTLEYVIIVLLLAQLLLHMFEILGTMSATV